MPPRGDTDATAGVLAHGRGDLRAATELMPLIYQELRALAARYMRRERSSHSLEPTELVHEAYLRLVDIDRVDWRGKTHFYAVAARQMRRVLVDHARRAGARKRGVRAFRVTLGEDIAAFDPGTREILALDEALEHLEGRHPRRSQVAELRIFVGMQVDEIAHVLGVSPRTVKDDWRLARAWLARQLTGQRKR